MLPQSSATIAWRTTGRLLVDALTFLSLGFRSLSRLMAENLFLVLRIPDSSAVRGAIAVRPVMQRTAAGQAESPLALDASGTRGQPRYDFVFEQLGFMGLDLHEAQAGDHAQLHITSSVRFRYVFVGRTGTNRSEYSGYRQLVVELETLIVGNNRKPKPVC